MKSLFLLPAAFLMVSFPAQAQQRLHEGQKIPAIASECLGVLGGGTEVVLGASASEAGIGVPILLKGCADTAVNVKNIYRTVRYNEAPGGSTALSWMGEKMGAGPILSTALDVADVAVSALALDFDTVAIRAGRAAPLLDVAVARAANQTRFMAATATGFMKWMAHSETVDPLMPDPRQQKSGRADEPQLP